ncbi:hypothetical protein CON46_29360, partial [Bacillus cereus]
SRGLGHDVVLTQTFPPAGRRIGCGQRDRFADGLEVGIELDAVQRLHVVAAPEQVDATVLVLEQVRVPERERAGAD